MSAEIEDKSEAKVMRKKYMSQETYDAFYGKDGFDSRLEGVECWQRKVKALIWKIVVGGLALGGASAIAWEFIIGG